MKADMAIYIQSDTEK